MKTILVGYADRDGRSDPEILAGPEVPAGEQAAAMEAVKQRHQFPSGILRVEQYVLGDPLDVGIFIDDEAAAAARGHDETRKKRETAARERAKTERAAEVTMIGVNKAFTAAANKRNAAVAAVSLVKERIGNADGKNKDGLLKDLAKAAAAADQAIAEFAVVREARDTIKDPKAKKEDVALQLERLKDLAKAAAADKEAAEKAKTESTPAQEPALPPNAS